MMKISNLINITEKKYLTTLEVFFMEKWGDTKLWSHDLSHHKRVWNYAKELLNYSDEVDNQFIEKLLIACYLHDIGMIIERGEKHGIQSRRLCEEFLSRNEMNTSDFTDLLHVIEYHDNKNYQDSSGQNILFTILTVADDLDALGYIGIYRYAEIYLLRGVSYQNIGNLILENAGRRFENFRSVFREYPELIEKHGKRYYILNDFYKSYNNSLSNYNFNSNNHSGHCGIIEIISKSINRSISFKEMVHEHNFVSDPIIIDFSKSLLQE